MGFGNAVKTCFRKYFTFSGRASRPEYWWFALFVFVGSLVLGGLDASLFGTTVVETDGATEIRSNGPLGGLFALATFIPGLSAGWRRMHDSGRSGFYLLYPLIVMLGIGSFAAFVGGFDPLISGSAEAVVGSIAGLVLLVAGLVFLVSPLLVLWWLTRPSQPGSNEYGPNPQRAAPWS
ncbi:uncharacterized membrane protein YhaH (DUF805 family) [Rhodovulum iodosum]|uniref:Uncharacterized membrane protein YhaH (DUF805 family) n=1 Tax=Rhodovulum iodosum TaxID=68291 RepID=A0ABV3XSD2_9RHOB|nr:DUF805 domain-containing protein [Rhodovulum robiginosum]RSK30559.1 DUF805 domain-containing protein [Rhodovulum robiginosum]